VLLAQHLPDDLLDRHPVPTGHRRPPFVEPWEVRRWWAPRWRDLRSFRPTGSYTKP